MLHTQFVGVIFLYTIDQAGKSVIMNKCEDAIPRHVGSLLMNLVKISDSADYLPPASQRSTETKTWKIQLIPKHSGETPNAVPSPQIYVFWIRDAQVS
jgi:hypothetical protein